MRPKTITLGPLATPDADGICQSQTPGGAGDLTINGALASGGVATLDVPRRVLVTTVSDESAKTLTIYGTDRNGISISETMTGPNATTGYTDADFKTVTRVAVSAAFTGAVTVGTNQVFSSQWVPHDIHRNGFNLTLGVELAEGATLTYTVQHTLDDPFATPGAALTPTDHADIVDETTDQQGNYAYPVRATRVTITAYTDGSLDYTTIQAGIAGR